MHRDTKLGLALAILVMGFAAALCFPREPDEKPVNLALQQESAQELDVLIGRGQDKLYHNTERPKRRELKETPKTPPPVLAADQEVLPTENATAANQAAPRASEPTPIEPANLPPEVIASPEPVVHMRTHVVEANETLSGIARLELGDGTKSQVLWDANPQLGLRDPKDLKPGMELLIPIPDGEEVTPATATPRPIVSAPPAPPAATPRPDPVAPRRPFVRPRVSTVPGTPTPN